MYSGMRLESKISSKRIFDQSIVIFLQKIWILTKNFNSEKETNLL